MSSIAFQKRSGDATVDGQILLAVKDSARPEIYKMAKMFAPNVELIPIEDNWYINENHQSDWHIDLPGIYFGIFNICHTAQDVGPGGKYKRSWLRLFHNEKTVHESVAGTYGNDDQYISTTFSDFTGFCTSLHLGTIVGDQVPEHRMAVNFIGFKLGAYVPARQDINAFNSTSSAIYMDSINGGKICSAHSEGSVSVPFGTVVRFYTNPPVPYLVDGDQYDNTNPYQVIADKSYVLHFDPLVTVTTDLAFSYGYPPLYLNKNAPAETKVIPGNSSPPNWALLAVGDTSKTFGFKFKMDNGRYYYSSFIANPIADNGDMSPYKQAPKNVCPNNTLDIKSVNEVPISITSYVARRDGISLFSNSELVAYYDDLYRWSSLQSAYSKYTNTILQVSPTLSASNKSAFGDEKLVFRARVYFDNAQGVVRGDLLIDGVLRPTTFVVGSDPDFKWLECTLYASDLNNKSVQANFYTS